MSGITDALSVDEVRSVLRRFITKIEPDANECWRWQATISRTGYARLSVGDRCEEAHRVVYELFCGDIPDGYTIDHLCRVRDCVNPMHLEAVTQRENILRGVGMGAQHARREHCLHGHPLTPENTQIRPDGGRRCLTCRRESNRRARERARARRIAA